MSLVQYTTLAVAVITITLEIIWMRRNREVWYYEMPFVLVLLHAVVYYIMLWFDTTDVIDFHRMFNAPLLFSAWSATLRLHSYFTLLIIVSMRLGISWKSCVAKLKSISTSIKAAINKIRGINGIQ